MPVYKYRDISEMGDVWHEPGDPRLMRAIRATWGLALRTVRLRFPPGVYRHRSSAAADQLRQEWERANFGAFRERRRRSR